MSIRKLMVFVLMLSICLPAQVFAEETGNATNTADYEQTARNYVEHFVREAYDPYYIIHNIQVTLKEVKLQDNHFQALADVSMVKELKAQSAEELPYVQALHQEMKSIRPSIAANDYREVQAIVKDQVAEFDQYIGVEQDQNDIFRISGSIEQAALNTDTITLEFKDYMDFVPAEAFIPNSNQSVDRQAAQDIRMEAASVEENTYMLDRPTASLTALAAIKYNRIAARDYANKWTNNMSNSHPETYNPAYPYYPNDCANFVSQAIRAGGIPTDSVWKSGSQSWLTTGFNGSNGLKQYMVDNKGYFQQGTKATTAAGGFIFARTYSHVMFVVANDGVTMLYSAHTNDRLKSSFAGFKDSEYAYYKINPAYL
ncbi:amidase domain-containing protein [Paenibacillus sp. Z6-24]